MPGMGLSGKTAINIFRLPARQTYYGPRQFDDERRGLTSDRAEIDAPAMLQHNESGYAEPQTGTCLPPPIILPRLGEPLENMTLELFGYTRPVIRYRDSQHLARVIQFDLDRLAGTGESDGIGKQICQRLHEAVGISTDEAITGQ